MDIEQFKISKKQIAAFLVICAGLYFITSSFLMSLGVMVLLIIAVNILALVVYKRRRRATDDGEENRRKSRA